MSSKLSSIGRRYAEALLGALSPEDNALAIAGELELVSAHVASVFDLRNALYNPAFSPDERQAVLSAVADLLGVSKAAKRLLLLLVEKDRIRALAEVAEHFRAMAENQAGHMLATVESASPLEPAEQDALRRALSQLTHREVEVRFSTKAELIGGIRTEIGSVVVDGSILGFLRQFADRIR
jgi:F-type H+-transporting ATPase subunit delta